MNHRFKLLLSILGCAGVLTAQTIKVNKTYRLPLTSTIEKGFYPVFSQSGSKLLFTSETYKGLKMYDFKAGKFSVVTDDDGAGYNPIFTDNDQKIYFRSSSLQSGRKYDALKIHQIALKQNTEVLTAQRNMKVAVNNHNFILPDQPSKMKRQLAASQASTTTYVCGENLDIVVYKDGVRSVLNPFSSEAHTYLWISLSPDGKKILFTSARKGTFVCDLNGKIVASLGKINAPVWYDNNLVVGMEDKDNGQDITSSRIMMISLDGKVKKQLSENNHIAMYPAAASASGKVAYCTLKGEIQIVELQIGR